MRYLKIYENFNDIEYFKQDIKDRFSFIIHDFDLEEIPHDLEEHDDTPGIFYDYSDFSLTDKGQGHFDIMIWVGINFVDKFKIMWSSIIKFIESLTKIGYHVITSFDKIDDYIGYVNFGYTEPFEIVIDYNNI